MPKWKKDETKFTVTVNYHETRGYQCNIPKPIMEALGEPDKLTFEINGKNVSISSGNTEKLRQLTKKQES